MLNITHICAHIHAYACICRIYLRCIYVPGLVGTGVGKTRILAGLDVAISAMLSLVLTVVDNDNTLLAVVDSFLLVPILDDVDVLGAPAVVADVLTCGRFISSGVLSQNGIAPPTP